MQPRARDLAIAIGAASIAACNGGWSGPDSDAPVPVSAPRAEIALVVTLAHEQGCEERFALALYEDRAIDLVTWDDRRGACGERTIVVRWLANEAREDRVIGLVKRHALAVERKVEGAK